MQLSGKRALVTGASSGIGRSIAVELARSGCAVILAARRLDVLAQVAAEIEQQTGHRPHIVGADLAKRGGAAALANRVRTEIGHVDVLVNNAGASVVGYQHVVGDGDEARELLELNVWSAAALVAALVPDMRERGVGAVVNVTSVLGTLPWPTMSWYTASKAALAALTDTLRLELAGSGVRVVEVIPGAVATPMQGESLLVPGMTRMPGMSRPGSPDRLARLVVKAVARDKKRVVYPHPLRVVVGLPTILRLFATYQASRARDEFNLDDTRVLRSGSFGDPIALRARDAWSRGIRDPQILRGLDTSGGHPVPPHTATAADPRAKTQDLA